jgi:hypothetical protein
MAAAGIAPRIMGAGPIEAVRKLLVRNSITVDQLDVIELNEAFASQAIATLRNLGVDPFHGACLEQFGGDRRPVAAHHQRSFGARGTGHTVRPGSGEAGARRFRSFVGQARLYRLSGGRKEAQDAQAAPENFLPDDT